MLQASITEDAERKILEILRVIYESPQPIGSATIAQKLVRNGLSLGERSIRLYLQIADYRNFTQLIGREGRCITPAGIEELKAARITEQVGHIYHKLELLSFLTTFDPKTKSGQIPVNTTLIHKEDYPKAISLLKHIIKNGYGVSELFAAAGEGETLGSITIQKGNVGLATVCSVAATGVLLKAGIPVDYQFSGVLEIADYKPKRFIAIIDYKSTTLNPSEQFIRSRMTNVCEAARTGNGRVLALFRTFPAPAYSIVEEKNNLMKKAGLHGIFCLGKASLPVCHVNVDLNRIGMILLNGINPIAAIAETGIEIENIDENNLIDFSMLKPVDRWE